MSDSFNLPLRPGGQGQQQGQQQQATGGSNNQSQGNEHPQIPKRTSSVKGKGPAAPVPPRTSSKRPANLPFDPDVIPAPSVPWADKLDIFNTKTHEELDDQHQRVTYEVEKKRRKLEPSKSFGSDFWSDSATIEQMHMDEVALEAHINFLKAKDNGEVKTLEDWLAKDNNHKWPTKYLAHKQSMEINKKHFVVVFALALERPSTDRQRIGRGWTGQTGRNKARGKAVMTGLQDEPSHLCSRCSTIPFDAIVNVPTKAVNLELGLFQEIVSKSEHCSFCRLVIQAFHAHLDPHWRPGEHPDQMCYLQVDEQQAGSSSPLIKVYCDITSDSMPKGFFGSYRLLGFIGAPLEDNTSDGTKIVSPATTGELDYGLISSWIEDCQSHDECSVGSDPSPEGATGIWLVDVQDMCLVQRDWDCRYIALSYVWGDLVAFRSQKTNFPSLQSPVSLNGVMGQMPQVIQDAITFTANVKQRYLWVDSLCIVQDDDTFKERYIPRMHLIYQSSLATIVATTGKDANKGLPGISYPREAPYTPIRFGARSLEAKPPCLLPLMWKSKWKTRAWTFQEGIFSGKCIYFTDYQVFWVCSARRASESNTEYYHDGMHLWENSSTSLFSRSSATYPESVYQSLVQGYSNRTLSHHSDSLSAFAGLLSKMGESFDWKFVSALPEKSFESFLFWMAPYGGVLRPRNNAAKNSDDMVCRSPTWCWTAWDAYVYWDPWRQDEFMGKAVTAKSEVAEYWISETAGFRRIGDKEHSDHGDQMFASSLHEKQPYILDSRRLESDVPSNTLMFRGKIIDAKAFEIKSPTFGPTCSRYFQGHLTGAGWLYDSNGRHCGTLRGINFSKNHDQEKWRMILLSRSDQDEVLQADIDATPSTDLPPEYPSAKEYYEEIFDTTAYNYRRWWALNIMLVARKGMWVERVAVGQIHADAWDSALGHSSPETIFLA